MNKLKKSLSSVFVIYFLAESFAKLIYAEILSVRKHLFVLIIQAIIFLTLLFSFWATIVAMAILALHDALGNWLPSLAIVAGINAIFLALTMFLLRRRSQKINLATNIKSLIRERIVSYLR